MYRVILFVLVFTGFSVQQVSAQIRDGFSVVSDTLPDIDIEYVKGPKANLFGGRPGKAALYSLMLPGAGQAYNKKYWQVPIVWAGMATAGGIMINNIGEYNYYRDAYRERLIAEMEGRPSDGFPELDRFSNEQIRNQRNVWDRYRQISIFAFAFTWIANSAHAYVSTHLRDFDISDDLTLSIMPFSHDLPSMSQAPVIAGVMVRF